MASRPRPCKRWRGVRKAESLAAVTVNERNQEGDDSDERRSSFKTAFVFERARASGAKAGPSTRKPAACNMLTRPSRSRTFWPTTTVKKDSHQRRLGLACAPHRHSPRQFLRAQGERIRRAPELWANSRTHKAWRSAFRRALVNSAGSAASSSVKLHQLPGYAEGAGMAAFEEICRRRGRRAARIPAQESAGHSKI